MSIYDHLEELRRRLLIMIVTVVTASAAAFAFSERLLIYLELPMHGYPLHFTGPLEPLFALLKISVATGIVVASPLLLYQIIVFILPALTGRERRMLFAYLPAALVLFAAGLAFGFFVFIPLVMSAMFRLSGPKLLPIITVGSYTSFLISFMLPFGIVFELPVAVAILVRLGILSAATLARGRRWALLFSVFVGAAFAPPDPVTPLVMATPIYLLFEASIWIARIVGRRGTPSATDREGPSDGD